jgi:hypothetical protein
MTKQSKTSSKSASSQVSPAASSASKTPASQPYSGRFRRVTAEELALVREHSQNAVTLSVRPRPASLRSRPASTPSN